MDEKSSGLEASLPSRKSVYTRLYKAISNYANEFAFRDMDGGRCRLIMLFPFKPFSADENKLYIDSYYLCSNASYHLQRELALKIKAETGFDAVVSEKDINLKLAVFEAGLSGIGFYNSLSYHSDYGSYFYIGSMIIDHGGELVFPKDNWETVTGDFLGLDKKTRKPPPNAKICAKCKRCVRACPTEAIKEEGGLVIEKCIRFNMNDAFDHSPLVALKASNCVMGCHFCQTACPLNEHIEKLPYPNELHELSIKALNEDDPAVLKKLLGKNIAKRGYFEKLVMNAKSNIDNKNGGLT